MTSSHQSLEAVCVHVYCVCCGVCMCVRAQIMKPHLLNYWHTFASGIGLEEKSFLVRRQLLQAFLLLLLLLLVVLVLMLLMSRVFTAELSL